MTTEHIVQDDSVTGGYRLVTSGEVERSAGTLYRACKPTVTKSRADEIRRQLRSGGSVDSLFVNVVKGDYWVASMYWARPYSGSLLQQLVGEVSPAIVGPTTWDLNGSRNGDPINQSSVKTPAIDQVVPDYSEHVELSPVMVLGVHAHVSDGHPMFTVGESQTPIAVDKDYVFCVVPSAHEIGNGSPERFSWQEPCVILKGNPDKPLAPLSIWREQKSIHLKDGSTTSLVFAGIIMPIRISQRSGEVQS